MPQSAVSFRAVALCALLILCGGCFGEAVAAPGAPLTRTLANGLRVVQLEDHTLPIVSVSLWVGAGSKDEAESSVGYAHFLEHMVQRGTDKDAPFDIMRRAQRWGGSASVRSNYDRTSITLTGTPAALREMIDAAAGMAFRAALKDSEIDLELATLTQEIRTYYDMPASVAFLETMRAAFPEHPYRIPMLGNFKTLGALKSEPLKAFYSNLYVPNNMALAVAGDFDPKDLAPRIESAFGGAARNALLPPPVAPPAKFAGHVDVEKRLDFKENWTTLSFVGPGYRHPDRIAFEVLAAALADASSPVASDLTKEGAGTLSQVSYYGLEDAGVLYFAVIPVTPELSYGSAGAVLRGVEEFKKTGLNDAALRDRISRMLRDERLRAGSMADRAEHLGEAALFGGARYYWDRPLALQALTPADVRRVAGTYLVAENLRLVVLMPKATPPLADAAKAAFHTDFDALGAAPAGAGTGFAANLYSEAEGVRATPEAWGDPKAASGLGIPQRSTLKNGLTVLVVEDHRQPIAAISLHARSGSGDDPAGREGLSGLTLRMLAGRMAARAAEITGPRRLTLVPEAQVTRDFMEIRFVGPVDEMTTGLQALARALPAAPVTDAEVTSLRQGALLSLQRADRDPDATSLDLFREKVYAGDAYAHRPDGTPGGLQAITRDDLQSLAGSALTPERLVLAVAGDVDPKGILRTVERLFGSLPGRSSARAEGGRPAPADAAASSGPPSATAGAQPGEYSRQLAAGQSRIVVGVPASALLGTEFSDLRLVGAGLSLLAFEDLVFTQRAAFSVMAVPEGLRRGGSLAFEVVAAHNRRGQALFDLKRLLRRLAIEDLSDPDRRDLGRMLSGRDAAAAQGTQALASNLAYREAAGLDAMRYRDDFNLPTPTAARIKEMAERYLKPESWISVIVGPPSP